MAQYDITLTKNERQLARAVMRENVAVFTAKKQARRAERMNTVEKELGKKAIVLTASQCTTLHRCIERSRAKAVKALNNVMVVNAKHVTNLNALAQLAEKI
mgnify:CR=1 FL=1